MKTTLPLIAFLLCVSPRSGAAVTVSSYSMQNGETGIYNYFDDAYTGSGDKTTALSSLTGGVGELTDGFIATQNWNITPTVYVGWQSINPVISFFLDGLHNLTSVTLSLDSSNNGGVSLPSSVQVFGTGYDQTFFINPGQAGNPNPYNFFIALPNLELDVVSLRIFDGASGGGGGSGNYIMLSEVTFSGNAVPEVSTAILSLLGLSGLALRRRR